MIIDIAADLGIPCEETSLLVSDLCAAEECFLTGTGAELVPVRKIDGHEFSTPLSPMIPRSMAAFEERIANYCSAE